MVLPAREAWALRAPVAPSVRRGLYSAIPVGIALLVDLELDSQAAGALAIGAFIAGFIAFDALPRTRFTWQLLAAPAIGAAGALGALTGDMAWLAVMTIAAFGSLAGLAVAVSPRLAVAGLTVTLALLIAQGFSLDPDDALLALGLGSAGAAGQALFTLATVVRPRALREQSPSPDPAAAIAAVRASLHGGSVVLHHAVRFGAALGIGTAAYHLVDLGAHGYWIPLTVLFVLKPTPGETGERIAMRAAGTVAGLVIATLLAHALGGSDVPEAIVLSVAAGLSFALLAIEYALFTTAITTWVVLLTDALGEAPLDAAEERAAGTAFGLLIVGALLVAWRDP